MLRWDHLSPQIVPHWAELTNLLAAYDDTGEFYEPADLAEELTEHGFEPAADSWTVWDGETLVAYGQLRVSGSLTADGFARAGLDGGVHPEWRGRGIGTALLDRMEPRALRLAATRHPGAPIQVRPAQTREDSDAATLFARRGFAPSRWFTDMRRPLPGEALPAAAAHTVPLAAEHGEALRQAQNDAFSTHWGSTAQTPAMWQDYLGSRGLRPGVSRLVVDDDGAVLAYALVEEWVARECYFGLIGTVQRARGRGLARGVLVASLHAAIESGSYDVATLEVDTANPTGAGRLYASVGFTPVRTRAAFTKVVQPMLE
ncbi:GNAT family N-acetyltransferase [Flexivirga caeni]|uniref:GNAT family N-acetyltransferase n=1 Tax=Flexivirga caeni TaxID=2294115 RepID=A0A3M9M9T1_9MICO|nr:GNAT family N-acetyltransferase [Flexivirga caeni]RNI21623.1 GNAT family N-acetyltransferase [Flexivirga caeni]